MKKVGNYIGKKWYVYFIRELGSDSVKIGYAEHLADRVSGIQTDNPRSISLQGFLVCRSKTEAQKVEKHLHNRFALVRIRGEWFTLSVEEVDCILRTQ